jgi:hypothetical protein
MNFFKKNDTLELQSQIDDLMEEKFNLIKEMKDYKKTISSFVDVKSVYESEKLKLMESHKQEIQTLKQSIESEKKSVARKVNQELAKIGIKQEFLAEEISPNGPDMTSPEMIRERWMIMPESPEKHEFFRKYEKIIGKSIKK